MRTQRIMIKMYPKNGSKMKLHPNYFHPDSDLLFGGIISTASRIGVRVRPLMEKLKVSSAFPLISTKNLGERYFLPSNPEILLRRPEVREKIKEIRKIRYLDLEVLFENKKYERWGQFALESDFSSQLKKMLMRRDSEKLSHEGFIKRVEIARNTLDRLTSISTLYYLDYVQCYESSKVKTGYWAIVESEEDTFKDVVNSIRVLDDEGVGGERGAGWGQFRIELCEIPDIIENLLVEDYESYLLISLLFFKDKTLLEELVGRRYITMTVKSKFLRGRRVDLGMISEGAISSTRIEGENLEIEGKVFHGKGTWIGLKGDLYGED